ncbi:MAG: GNAT family N-acetyltransferase [Cyanobacteria bacterium P01_G01_bin.49]
MFLVPLKTERLVIRKFQQKDLSAFLEFMLDEESTKYLAFTEEQKTEEGAKALFDLVYQSYESQTPIHSYVIAGQDQDHYLGSCGFTPYDEDIYECYYSVSKAQWGQGVATEAIKTIAEELSKTAEIRAYCHPNNVAAHRVAKKAGFIPKGLTLHQHFDIEGELFVYPRNNYFSPETV